MTLQAAALVWSATCGTVTPTSDSTATFRAPPVAAQQTCVVTASRRAADTPGRSTATVVPTPVVLAGIPFGPTSFFTSSTESPASGAFTLAQDGVSAGYIVSRIAAAREKKIRLLLNMTGGHHNNYMSVINDTLRFDRAKWDAKLVTYNTPAIKQAIADAVRDGTVIGNSVMDEPHVYGLGDGNTWGPKGTMTKARVDSLCAATKAMFPTLPVGVVHGHADFEPSKSYRMCEFLVDSYSSKDGSVAAYRDAGLSLARRDGMAIVYSMNVLNGGTQAARDGAWNCSLSTTGGRGTYDPNCRMTSAQVRDFGRILGVAGCAMVFWRYDSAFVNKSDNAQALKDVAATLATTQRPATGCARP